MDGIRLMGLFDEGGIFDLSWMGDFQYVIWAILIIIIVSLVLSLINLGQALS